MSSSESWDVNRHTVRCTSSVSMVTRQCKLVYGWIPGHVGLEGNTEADLEAKRGTSLPQSYGFYFCLHSRQTASTECR